VVSSNGSRPTRNHTVPPDCEKNDSHISNIGVWVEQAKELDHETQRIGYDTERADDERPKVESMVVLKRHKGEDDEFNGIVEGQAKKKGSDDFER